MGQINLLHNRLLFSPSCSTLVSTDKVTHELSSGHDDLDIVSSSGLASQAMYAHGVEGGVLDL